MSQDKQVSKPATEPGVASEVVKLEPPTAAPTPTEPNRLEVTMEIADELASLLASGNPVIIIDNGQIVGTLAPLSEGNKISEYWG